MFQHKIPQLNPMRPTQNMRDIEKIWNNFKHPTASKRISKEKENN
jgi:hypothetical protein